MSDASRSRRAVRFRTVSQVDLQPRDRTPPAVRILDRPPARGVIILVSGPRTPRHLPDVNQVVEDSVLEAGGGGLDFAESICDSSCEALVPPSTCRRGRRKRSSPGLPSPARRSSPRRIRRPGRRRYGRVVVAQGIAEPVSGDPVAAAERLARLRHLAVGLIGAERGQVGAADPLSVELPAGRDQAADLLSLSPPSDGTGRRVEVPTPTQPSRLSTGSAVVYCDA